MGRYQTIVAATVAFEPSSRLSLAALSAGNSIVSTDTH